MSVGPLDLSNADTSGFEAIDAGRYAAEIFEMKWDAVKNANGQGKMPAGTPMLKVQFKITEEPHENRRQFAQYVVPPADYDPEKARKMKGMLVNFFVATGDEEDKVKSSAFEPEFDDYIGRPVVIVLSKVPKKDAGGNVIEGEFENRVTGVKPAGSDTGANSGLL